MPPGGPERSGASGWGRARWGLVAAAVLLLSGAALWRWRDDGARSQASRPREREAPVPLAPSSRPPAPPAARRAPVSAVPPAAGDALSAALREERVTLSSSVVIEDLESDRAWVCAGEPMNLSARVGGEPEPDAVHRWVWLTAGGGAELQPGPALQWRAPATAGRHLVHFQVCKDLGGRRVGVLAERVVELDVRACGEGEGQVHEPLRLVVAQRGHGAFEFQAVYQGPERVETYVWSLGDGTTATTSEPRLAHTYPIQALDLQEVKSFTVKLEARLARGHVLEATAFALTRGRPPTYEPLPVDLEVSRWRPLPDGGGWRSDVVVRNPAGTDIRWDRLERITVYWDDRVDSVTRRWSEVLHVEESFERGGFRGYVTVSPAEAPREVKQLLDFLYGQDATGKEVVVSWSPFKREAPPEPLPDAGRPGGK